VKTIKIEAWNISYLNLVQILKALYHHELYDYDDLKNY